MRDDDVLTRRTVGSRARAHAGRPCRRPRKPDGKILPDNNPVVVYAPKKD